MTELNYSDSVQFIASKTRNLKIVRFFRNADLRCGHDGLRKMAKEHSIDPWKLEPGQFLVFSNAKQNKLKIYAPGNILCYVKSTDDRRIDLRIVQFIPRFFNGTEFQYEAAVKEMLKKELSFIAVKKS